MRRGTATFELERCRNGAEKEITKFGTTDTKVEGGNTPFPMHEDEEKAAAALEGTRLVFTRSMTF